jgi:nucleotidyltransferase substrate binding protein (TIGR01987 family)
MLDISSLQKAVASLERGIRRASAAGDDEELRDAVIQRFEYTYELCWKMLKRRLEMDHPHPAEVDQMSFQGLLREGGERGLIEDVGRWMGYREQRNITAHTYDRTKAESVYATALEFIGDAKKLLSALGRF